MKLYRVQKVTPTGDLIEEAEVRAGSAEEAAAQLVPGKLYRGEKGKHAVLRAKVYAPSFSGTTTLVRLYERQERAPYQ